MYRFLAALAVATAVYAVTPEGFEPSSTTDLIVDYNGLAAMNGVVMAKEATQTAPTIATTAKLNGTSFAVIMIDLDIPTNSPPATSTLLHWMQTGLTLATSATVLNTTAGQMEAFMLRNASNTAALASYIGPNPPARVPLSHRYTQILVDTTSAGANATSVLQQAAATRQGFNAVNVLTSAGLLDKVVAGNFFNVTNAGPATSFSNSTTGTTTGGGSTAGTGSTGTSPTPTASLTAAAVASGPQTGIVACLLAVTWMLLTL
ncbi:PEBP-like protein [Pleurostoma richardsiae]|uniref:PEBP-like protein n=1 Tax=Pleurostoma richardsiae TaxID=41990 RepID=A0AA38VJL8_9PEZI|nr:PEBP-like protein [Pleurostoma richardsiae]